MLMVGSDTYFLEVGAHVSLKVATKDYFRGKKPPKLALLSLLPKAETWELISVFD